MKTLIFFGIALTLVGFAQFEDPGRHINNIERHSQHWFDKSSTVRYSKIVRHSTHETKAGGRVCFRAIHPAYVDVICLGWRNNAIVNLDNYRLK